MPNTFYKHICIVLGPATSQKKGKRKEKKSGLFNYFRTSMEKGADQVDLKRIANINPFSLFNP
jgi:hypothetical protein